MLSPSPPLPPPVQIKSGPQTSPRSQCASPMHHLEVSPLPSSPCRMQRESTVDLEEVHLMHDAHLDDLQAFQQDWLLNLQTKPYKKSRKTGLYFGAGLLGILALPFGPIGMTIGGTAGGLMGAVVGRYLDKKRQRSEEDVADKEKRRLKYLLRFVHDRFSTCDDPAQMLEKLMSEFQAFTEIGAQVPAAKLQLLALHGFLQRVEVRQCLWVYFDEFLTNWRNLTSAEFVRICRDFFIPLVRMYKTLGEVSRITPPEVVEKVDKFMCDPHIRRVFEQAVWHPTRPTQRVIESIITTDMKRRLAKAGLRADDSGVALALHELENQGGPVGSKTEKKIEKNSSLHAIAAKGDRKSRESFLNFGDNVSSSNAQEGFHSIGSVSDSEEEGDSDGASRNFKPLSRGPSKKISETSPQGPSPTLGIDLDGGEFHLEDGECPAAHVLMDSLRRPPKDSKVQASSGREAGGREKCFFRNFKDFCNFDSKLKQEIPISSDEFRFLLEKECESFSGGWDLCTNRKDAKVMKLRSENSPVVLVRAWAYLKGIDPAVVMLNIYKNEERAAWDKTFSDFRTVEENFCSSGCDVLYSKIKAPIGISSRDFVQYRKILCFDENNGCLPCPPIPNLDKKEEAQTGNFFFNFDQMNEAEAEDRHKPDNAVFESKRFISKKKIYATSEKTFLILMRSAKHPSAPEQSSVVRAETVISGYVIRSCNFEGASSSRLFILAQTDVKGLIPKWLVNTMAARAPGQWVDNLQKACEKWGGKGEEGRERAEMEVKEIFEKARLIEIMQD